MKYRRFTMFWVYRKVIQMYRYRYRYRYRWASHVTVMVKNAPANTQHTTVVDSISGSGRSHGEGHGDPLQYSCLENLMDRGAWRAIVHRVAKSQTRLKWLSRHALSFMGLPWWLSGKESSCQNKRCRFDPWVGKIPWRRRWQPTPVFLPRKSHRQRSLVGSSPWGCKGVSTT